MKKKALILAAGRGERLVNGFAFPKPLKRVQGVPLIVRIIRNLERCGVRDVGIVVGHLGDVLIESLERYNFKAELSFFWNDEVDKPNGTSLLKAKEFVEDGTFLLMSDHLWASELFYQVAQFPLTAGEAVLGIDRDIPRCFDLDDATKVQLDGSRIVAIDKQLSNYNALDTGLFRITSGLIDALESVNGPDGCSLSDGVRILAEVGKMHGADVGDAMWIDVDTPPAHAEAEKLIRAHGERLRPTAVGVVAAAAL